MWRHIDGPSWIQYDLFRKISYRGPKQKLASALFSLISQLQIETFKKIDIIFFLNIGILFEISKVAALAVNN